MLKNLGVMCKCSKCKRESNSYYKDINQNITKEIALKKIRCCSPDCNNEFTIEEGFKENLKSDNEFFIYQLICDIKYYTEVDVIIGEAKKVELPQGLEEVEKVYCSAEQICVESSPMYTSHNKNYLMILTSELHIGGRCIGKRVSEEQKVDIYIYGFSKEKPKVKALWLEFLKEAKKELKNKSYALSIASSAIACECFIDKLIIESLKEKGMNDRSAQDLLESMKNSLTKVNKVIPALENICTTNNIDEINKWNELRKVRNKIAHGSKLDYDENSAYKYFSIAVDFIFYLNRQSSMDNIYNEFFIR